MFHDELGRFRDIYEPARLAADVADAMARGALASDMMAANGVGLLAAAVKLQAPLRHRAQGRGICSAPARRWRGCGRRREASI